MAKQGGGKNKGKSKPKGRAKGKAKVAPEGDLTTIEAHVRGYLAGKTEAAAALKGMGRDAAFTVSKIAEAEGHDALAEFGRRLAAIPPQVETNMLQLRKKSVRRRVESERREAPAAFAVSDLAIEGGAVALFDPQRLVTDLATGGRPRQRPERLQSGDIACIGFASPGPVAVRLREGPAPDGQPTVRLRLHVESGLAFIGPPEASDGPRMGTVRLDPFSTRLDELAERGRFVRIPNGILALFGYSDGEGAAILHVVAPDPEPQRPLDLSPMAPVTLPNAVGP